MTIQPEFTTNMETGIESKTSSNNMLTCLIGCQSDDCLSKTCCSTNDLNSIVINNDNDNCKSTKSNKLADATKKSASMVSLNASSLIKLRQTTNEQIQPTIRKSVSESHVDDAVSGLSTNSIAEDEDQSNTSLANENCDQNKLTALSSSNTRHNEESSLLNGPKTDADKQFTAELMNEIEGQIRRQ